MSSVTGTSTVDLTKLTVPQLKAICKERKLTGYSKLGKNALIQTLSQVTGDSLDLSNVVQNVAQPQVASSSVSSIDGAPPTSKKAKVKARSKKQKDPPAAAGSSDLTPSISSVVQASTIVSLAVEDPPVSANHATSLHPLARNVGSESDQSPISSLVIDTTSAKESSSVSGVLSPSSRAKSGTTASEVPVLRSQRKNSMAPPSVIPAAKLSQSTTVPTTLSGMKRPCSPASVSALPSKKTKLAHTSTSASGEDVITSGTSASVAAPIFPRAPAASSMLGLNLTKSKPLDNRAIPNTIRAAPQTLKTATGKRFRPLVINKPLPMHTKNTSVSSRVVDRARLDGSISSATRSNLNQPPILYHLDFPSPSSVPALKSITLPPSKSQRTRVQCWAIILSGLTDKDRKQCVQVSRMFRYAVYLSASQTLQRFYDGQRLARVTKEYPQAMTNMWPYLRLREAEVLQRRKPYQSSFLGRVFRDSNPIADRLWRSSDNEKQIIIALRFVMTRFWFALSIGGKDHETWLRETVTDAREIVPNEIWSITVKPDHEARPEIFYVLESTCEVVGHPPSPCDPPAAAESIIAINRKAATVLRADWSAYIHHRLTQSHLQSPLLSHLKWANYEEYDKGISRLWTKRIFTEGQLGEAKRIVAERYVLACIVGNSVSGSWMSTAQMAQESAGMPSRMDVSKLKSKEPGVNLYLAAHHHVESVHFTTPAGYNLHPALAVVQTLHREYLILKDNGMEVGCEEEGVAEIWMEILNCDAKGLAL